MKRKFLAFGGVVFLFFVAWWGILVWQMAQIRAYEELVDLCSQQMTHISRLFYLGTKVHRQQIEIRRGISRDINPLVEDVLEMGKLLQTIERDTGRPEVVANCGRCHAQRGQSKWTQGWLKTRALSKALDVYKQEVSHFVTAGEASSRNEYEKRAVRAAGILVEHTNRLDHFFSTIMAHVTQQHHAMERGVIQHMGVVSVVAFVAVNLLFFLFARRIIAPIRRLEEATHLLSAGEFPGKVEIKTKDELAVLANAFNRMVDSLRTVTAERQKLLNDTQDFNALLERRIQEVRLELRRTQDQLVRHEKLSALGTLAAGVSHEISNPIHIIQGLCSVMLRDIEAESQLAEDLRLIDSEASRCQTIVSGLLDYSRRKEPEKVASSIESIIEATLEMMRRQRAFDEIRIDTVSEADLPEVRVDRGQLKQVLINLLINAGQAMPNGGRITIRSTRVTVAGGEGVGITVEDTGAGIPEEILSKVFDPFFTTKKGTRGTGLGLAVSYRIVKDHGGEIEVASRLGSGTAFIITLPVGQPEQVSQALS